MQAAGYSQAPLAKKLGIKEGFKVRLINQPDYYFQLFIDWPENVHVLNETKCRKNLIHYFTTEAKELEENITALKAEIELNGMIWISWPKKASKFETDITEDVVRSIALKHVLVDIKVCAVDDVWSGLKLVIPVKNR